MTRTDEERARLDSAVKPVDGFFATFLVTPYSKHVARWAAERGVTPNQVTVTSLAVGLVAAVCCALGSRPALVAGALLLQLSFTLDCIDGQIARYTRRFSALGAWLDSVSDRVKEYAVYAGLAVGSVRGFDDDVWALAAATLALQSVRHLADFSYAVTRAELAGVPAAAASPRSPLAAARRVTAGRGWTVWARRVAVLPIGERWALISVSAALSTPRLTFTLLLVAGTAAACYSLSYRLLLELGR